MTDPASAPVDITSGQVGESFGVGKMIEDAKAIQDAKTNNQKLCIEVAMLIESANTKRIQVAQILSGNNGVCTLPSFEVQLQSLAEAIGSGEDEETRQDLLQAVSRESIDTIATLCPAGKDHGNLTCLNSTSLQFSLLCSS